MTRMRLFMNEKLEQNRANAIRRKSDRFELKLVHVQNSVYPQQVHRLRKSFAQVEAHGSIAALVFYRILFERNPELRPLFKEGIEEQAAKLMAMLGILMTMLERGNSLLAELEEMGARHAGYGVQEEHYTAVREAMMAMLAEVLREDFTPETAQAWELLCNIAEEAMKKGAAQVTARSA